MQCSWNTLLLCSCGFYLITVTISIFYLQAVICEGHTSWPYSIVLRLIWHQKNRFNPTQAAFYSRKRDWLMCFLLVCCIIAMYITVVFVVLHHRLYWYFAQSVFSIKFKMMRLMSRYFKHSVIWSHIEYYGEITSHKTDNISKCNIWVKFFFFFFFY